MDDKHIWQKQFQNMLDKTKLLHEN